MTLLTTQIPTVAIATQIPTVAIDFGEAGAIIHSYNYKRACPLEASK